MQNILIVFSFIIKVIHGMRESLVNVFSFWYVFSERLS